MTRPQFYVLNGHSAVAVADVMAWVTHSGGPERRLDHPLDEDPWRVDCTEVGECTVSTVFLGLDHQWHADGPPLLFETMIFGEPFDEDCQRCSTWDEAVAQHAAAIERVRESL